MKLKKILAAAMAAVLCLSLASCGEEKDTESSSAAADSSAAVDSNDPAAILTDAKIGVQLGTTGDIYISGDIDSGALGKATITQYNKGMEAVQALMQGKLDAVVIDNQPAQVFVEENEGLKLLDTAYAEEDYAICISKKKPELKEQFNKAIAELKEDGTLQNLMDFYIEKKDDAKPYTSPEGIKYDGKLIMATNAEFPPYEYHDSSTGEDLICGLDVDFAKAICDKLGKELEVADMAFDSIIVAVDSGKADFGAAGMTVTEDRLKSIDFTDSYCKGIQSVIVKE